MKLTRTTLGYGGAPTLGRMVSRDGQFACVTLERSADGEHPCIEAGIYPVVLDFHHPGDPNGYPCPELRDIPGRSEIQIHIANRASELLGCIAPGESVSEDRQSVERSRAAFTRLMTYLDGAFPFTLEIIDPIEHPEDA